MRSRFLPGRLPPPVHEPLAYLQHLPKRTLLLGLGQLTPIASEAALFVPEGARAVLLLFGSCGAGTEWCRLG